MGERVLRGPLAQARGVIGRYPGPDDRVVFAFDGVAPRLVHMLGVHRPLRVRWLVGDACVRESVLRPWVGIGRARADRIVETQP